MKKQQYEVHPVADVFPMMTGEAFEFLKEDIRVNGQREPIVFWKNMLVDGRNRLKACEELGLEPDESELMDETDPVAWVISHNLHRRHLSESQRAMVAAKLAKLKPGEVGNGRKVEGQICPSTESASKMLNVSKGSTKNAKKVIADGAEEVKQAVEFGELPVSVAADFVKQVPDKQEQAAIASQGAESVKEKVRQAKAKFDRAVKSVTQKCENEVNEFLLFWEQRSPKGKKAIWLWLVDNYENA